MEFRWLRKTGAEEVIVVFGGWAVGAEVFAHLEGPQDVLFSHDYRDLDADLPDLSAYANVSLLAWSFGVASYSHWQQGRADPFQRKLAVNGSLTPVNRLTGIPPVAMVRTVESLSHASFQQFLTRVFNAPQPDTPLEVALRRDELNAVALRGDAPEMGFDSVLVSSQDRIFPSASLTRAWQGTRLREVRAPHALFSQFKTWEELFG